MEPARPAHLHVGRAEGAVPLHGRRIGPVVTPRPGRRPSTTFLGSARSGYRMPRPKIEFVYAGLRVRNLRRSVDFYRKLGFRVHARGRMGHGGSWVQLTFPGAAERLELNYYPRGNPYYEPHRRGTEFDHLGFRVSDVEGWEAELRRRKLPIVARIREARENLVFTRDPDGHWLEFFGPVPG